MEVTVTNCGSSNHLPVSRVYASALWEKCCSYSVSEVQVANTWKWTNMWLWLSTTKSKRWNLSHLGAWNIKTNRKYDDWKMNYVGVFNKNQKERCMLCFLTTLFHHSGMDCITLSISFTFLGFREYDQRSWVTIRKEAFCHVFWKV